MLRDIKNKHLRPRLLGYKFTNDGTIVNAIGVGDVTQTRNDTGDTTTTFVEAFRRAPISFACRDTSGADGGYISGVSVAGSVNFICRDEAGSVEDANAYGLTLGWFSNDASLVLAQQLKGTQLYPRIEVFQVNTASSGSITIGAGRARLTRNGDGDVTLTFKNSFRNNNVIAVANACQATVIATDVSSATAESVRVKCFDTSNVAADGIFNLVVLGSDSRDTCQQHENPVQSSQRKPFIVGYKIAAAGASLTVGSQDGSVVRNAAGDYTITFSNTFFKRTPICLCMSSATSANGRGQILAQSSTEVEVLVSDASGTGADVAAEVLVIGFQDASEY